MSEARRASDDNWLRIEERTASLFNKRAPFSSPPTLVTNL